MQPDSSLKRVDGRLKVTGTATYSAEYPIDGLAHAVLLTSTITRGRISAVDSKAAEGSPGVRAVISHLNTPGVPAYGTAGNPPERATVGTAFRVFHDELIYFNGQPVALVVADTPEQARYAASLVRITYQPEPHRTSLPDHLTDSVYPAGVQRTKNSPFQDYTRGDPSALARAEVRLEATYTIPTQHHHPLEPHAIIAVWEAADRVTVYDKTQGVKSDQGAIARAFSLPQENVTVHAPFVGGAFGSAIRTWPHVIAAVLAAKKLNRPVKLVLGREQLFTSVGYRPFTVQKMAVGASRDGKLIAMSHEGYGQTSAYEEHLERTVLATRAMYACPNVTTRYRLVSLDVNTPTWMRGPGDATGMFALESALDELAYALRLDPLELRLRNYAASDPERNLPWSGKALDECYRVGAERFGWHKRSPEPRSMRTDGMLVGYGMASSLYGYHRHPSKARASLRADGTVVVQSAASDIGPGTGTAMVRIAADVLGLPAKQIRFDLGESVLPEASGQNGSSTIPSVGSAVHAACEALKRKLVQLASKLADPPFGKAGTAALSAANGRVYLKAEPTKGLAYTDIVKQHRLPQVEVLEESKPGPERDQVSMYSFGAHFVEVHVHPLTGEVRVKRALSAADVGKVINEETARSQSIGGVVGGIGMALQEESVMDHRFGRYVNNDFAGYHIPVHADIPPIEVFFTDRPDPYVNPIGAKGLGEIAIVGVAAAVANAVFHATGRRVRDLPITPDKLLRTPS